MHGRIDTKRVRMLFVFYLNRASLYVLPKVTIAGRDDAQFCILLTRFTVKVNDSYLNDSVIVPTQSLEANDGGTRLSEPFV